MSEDRKLVVNSYVIIQSGAMGDTHNRNRTDISGSKIDTLNAGSQASGNGGVVEEKIKVSVGRISILNDRARYLLTKSDYEGVAKLLDNPVITSSDDIAGKTLLAEAYLMLANEAKGTIIIEALKKVAMTSQMTGNDVMIYAKDLAANSAHTRAMILFPIACDLLHANALSPDEAVDIISECIKQLSFSVASLLKDGGMSRVAGEKFGIKYMKQMYKTLNSVTNAKTENQVVKQAWALYSIGINYGHAGKDEKQFAKFDDGIKLLKQHFDKKQFMIHGHLLNRKAYANFKKFKFHEAEKYYDKAIKAFESASDFYSQIKKREIIEKTTHHLNTTRAKLEKL